MSLSLAISMLSTSVDVGEESNSCVGTEINFSGKRSNSYIDPVLVGGGKLLS